MMVTMTEKADKTFKAACVQMRGTRSVDANIKAASALIREAAAGGADLIVTPEQSALMELDRERVLANTWVEDGNRALAAFTDLAAELGRWLVVGSLGIKVDDETLANRSYLISPDGAVVTSYDKIHMFDVDLPGGENYRESALYRAGNKAVKAELPWGRIGLTICYDLRFPQLYRALAHAGAHFITAPAAFTKVTGEAHWHTLIRSRAIETGCFLLAAAHGGHHENGRDTYGHSLIVSPWGDILAEAGTEPAVIFADIDPAEVARARARIPALAHDRPFAAADAGSGEAGLKAVS